MYIHKYQIHNVLNVYRKQLSQQTGARPTRPMAAAPAAERVQVSTAAQQSLIDQVSAEIVERLAEARPRKSIEGDRQQEAQESAQRTVEKGSGRQAVFTYTAIDEKNRKISTTLPLEQLSTLIDR